jgi:NitT/TauT family transport system permease protein
MISLVVKFIKSLLTFLIVYLIGLIFLFILKEVYSYNDYVIPDLTSILKDFAVSYKNILFHISYSLYVVTLSITISVGLACIVSIGAVFSRYFGSFISNVAFTSQAYPLVAIAPLIFIVFGEGIISRIIITTLICYFPLLLTLVGVLLKKNEQVEHFYEICNKSSIPLIIKIRLSENLNNVRTSLIGSCILAFVGAIVSEYIASNQGTGFLIRIALDSNRLGIILSILLVLGIIVWLFLFIIELITYFIIKLLNLDPNE